MKYKERLVSETFIRLRFEYTHMVFYYGGYSFLEMYTPNEFDRFIIEPITCRWFKI